MGVSSCRINTQFVNLMKALSDDCIFKCISSNPTSASKGNENLISKREELNPTNPVLPYFAGNERADQYSVEVAKKKESGKRSLKDSKRGRYIKSGGRCDPWRKEKRGWKTKQFNSFRTGRTILRRERRVAVYYIFSCSLAKLMDCWK